MLVKSVSKSVKDVFLGQGWDTWVRIDLDSRKVLKSNCTLKPNALKTIFEKVHK